MYSELELIEKSVFNPCGIEFTKVETELESQDYFAHNFELGGQKVKFRTSKITAKKTGQFVTIWKRTEKGITVPFDILDDIDFYIIAARQNENLGLFIFPKKILHENKILSDKLKDGKRGIRVYPPWDLATNIRSKKTQIWQRIYFLDLSQNRQIDLKSVNKLLNLN